MNSQDLTRLLIEGAVNRTLNQVKKDPHRSLRNLVDLGLIFSKGRFQQTFLKLAQSMLENEDSAYYTLLDLLVQRVDHETLKTFGVNIGYEALTRGAKSIRHVEETAGYSVPWILGIEAMDLETVRDLVRQGKELGIYVYCFCGGDVDLVALRELLEEEPRCAFALLTTGENLLRQGLEPLDACRNLYISVQTGELGLEAAEALSAGGFLYGIHVPYRGPECLAQDRLERYLDYRPAAVSLLPADEAALDQRKDLFAQAKALRLQQKYPYFLLDLVGDGLYVDQVISGEPSLLYVRGDGSALVMDQQGLRQAGDLRASSLSQVLRAALPGSSEEGSV